MLTVDSLNAAIPLTSVLDAKGLYLTPVPNTPLDKLVNATRSDRSFVTPNAAGEFDISVYDIEYIANAKDPALNISEHDRVADEIIEVVRNAVNEHMVFAKNVVAPAIESLVTDTMVTLKEMSPSSLLGMEVVVYNPPRPLTNSSLEDAVSKFRELPYDIPAMNLKLPDLTASEIIDLMASGSGNLDTDIKEWAAEKGESFFLNIWELLFQIKPATYDRKQLQFADYLCGDLGIDNALAIYLLARKLADKPLPNTEMSIDAFNKTIVEYRNQAAARLCYAFDELTKIEKTGQLVRSTNDRVTVVNGSVYRKWIEAGGENEILFGNLLDFPHATLVENINAKADQLKSLWNKHAAVTATIERNKRFTRTKEILQNVFYRQMRDIHEGEEATVGNRENIIKLFNEQLDRVREDELDDIWTLCLKLVCRSRFIRTDAERILLGIERVKKENPSISVREAAAVSCIEYTAYWLASQFVVKAV